MDATSSKLTRLSNINHTYSSLQKAVFLVVVYAILLFLLPTGKATIHAHNFTMLQYHIVNFAIVLPSLLVWLAAFIGSSNLRQYANSLRKTPEGEQFGRLATGCAWLAWSLPITALFALCFNSLDYEWPVFHATSIILINYSDLVLPLVAFSIIGVASRNLVSKAKIKINLTSSRALVLVYLTASVVYCYLTFVHYDLSDFGSASNPYYLPVWIMIITVIIPNLYAWFVGLVAAYEITLFSKQVHGLIYRRSLQLLVGGLVTIIASFIALQYVKGVEPPVGNLVFDYKLAVSVIFRVIGGAGFVMLAIGARKLRKFEEV